MGTQRGCNPIAPKLTPEQEKTAHALCGSWERGNSNDSLLICWEHCRPQISKSKKYCFEAARVVSGR